MIRIRLLGPGKLSDFRFPTHAAAEAALLAHAGHPPAERITVREATGAMLANGGLAEYAPAVLEVIGTGEFIVVPAPHRLLTTSGRVTLLSWRRARLLWEASARQRERERFAALPISRRAAERVIDDRIAAQPLVRLTHYSTPPGENFAQQLAATGCRRRAAGALFAHLLAVLAGLAAWTVIGRAALSGRWDEGWFWGWAALIALIVPLESLAAWWFGWLAIAFGGLLKQRLLAGSLEMDTDRLRHEGVGQLLSRVLETEALGSLSLSGGATAALALVELAAAAAVMAFGAHAFALAALFAAWCALTAWLAARYAHARADWLARRNQFTHDLVEKMNGHRTRLAQQPPAQWHPEEDRALDAYLDTAARVDHRLAWLSSATPRGWLAAGMLVTGLAFARLTGPAAAPVAIAVGGVLLGYQALRRLAAGLGQCAAAWQAWQMARELFRAAARAETETPGLSTRPVEAAGARPLELHDVTYSYPNRERTAVQSASLTIEPGDRVLLQGASGSGKSSFGALIAGLRRPASGLLLAGGVDLATVGAHAWRRRIAAAPQYHENHVLAAPLLFNLLMGCGWPPTAAEAALAEEVCRELALGPLLDRMPGGLMEIVGDTGWQLSQGERSRVYLARAILQDAPLLLLDESFAALDPETLDQCLACALKRAPSLLVIAHP